MDGPSNKRARQDNNQPGTSAATAGDAPTGPPPPALFASPEAVPHWDVCLAFDAPPYEGRRVYTHKLKLSCMELFATMFEVEARTEYALGRECVDAGLTPDLLQAVLPSLYDEAELPGVTALKSAWPCWLDYLDDVLGYLGPKSAEVTRRLRNTCRRCGFRDAYPRRDTCIACRAATDVRYDRDDPKEPALLALRTGCALAPAEAVSALVRTITSAPAAARPSCAYIATLLATHLQGARLDDDDAKAVVRALQGRGVACDRVYCRVFRAMMRPWTYDGPSYSRFRCFLLDTQDAPISYEDADRWLQATHMPPGMCEC